MAYKVELDVYCGPLDLLLYLIHEEEIDIYDIPVARILERYIEHLEHVKTIDINLAAEFLVMASQLMEIKSKMLLPAEDRAPEEEEEDPRAELVRQLLAYRAFKEAAGRLGEYREARSRRYGRGMPVRLPEEPQREAALEGIRDVSLFDLADSYARLMKETGASRTATIVYDEISMEARIEAILEALRRRDEFALRALLRASASRTDIVGTFFALLELVKEGQIRVCQNQEFGEIIVTRREDAEGSGEPEPAGPHVEPYLPPPRERIPDASGKKKLAGPRRAHFTGLDLPEDRVELGALEDEDDSDEPCETDERERRLNRRIDAILRRADEISARFEQSRAGRRRLPDGQTGEGAQAGRSAALDQAMAAFEDELGPDDGEAGTGGGDAAGGTAAGSGAGRAQAANGSPEAPGEASGEGPGGGPEGGPGGASEDAGDEQNRPGT